MEHEWVRIEWGFAYWDMDGWLTAHCINKKIITQHGLWLKTASSLELWYISTIGQNPWWYHSSGIFLASHSEHVLSKDTFWVGSTGQSTAASLAISASDPHRGNISCNVQDHSRPLWMVSWQIRSCLAAPGQKISEERKPCLCLQPVTNGLLSSPDRLSLTDAPASVIITRITVLVIVWNSDGFYTTNKNEFKCLSSPSRTDGAIMSCLCNCTQSSRDAVWWVTSHHLCWIYISSVAFTSGKPS